LVSQLDFLIKKTGGFSYDVNKATLYSQQEAEDVKKELLKSRIYRYQQYGESYQELHVGDLLKKGILTV